MEHYHIYILVDGSIVIDLISKYMNDNLVTDNLGTIRLYNGDCMEWMKSVPDKHYELAIVDPPFGINITKVVDLKDTILTILLGIMMYR